MKVRSNTVFISAVLLSLGLLSFIPASLHWSSTWKDLNIAMPGLSVQNYYMPLGFFSLGLELVGFITIWTGYVRGERQAWFVMLLITFFFVFPLNGLKLLLEIHASILSWADLVRGIRAGSWQIIWLVVGALTFLVMLISLMLPLPFFFGKGRGDLR